MNFVVGNFFGVVECVFNREFFFILSKLLIINCDFFQLLNNFSIIYFDVFSSGTLCNISPNFHCRFTRRRPARNLQFYS